MDENRRGYDLKAPGRSEGSSSMRLPGRDSFPRVDDHLVEPEVTRDEIIGGQRIVAMPANPPHARQHSRLGYVIQAHAAPGYTALVDLLTRFDEESDFATDACIYKEGVDPATGARHLEEIAFEVVSEQSERLVTEKARRMHRRGVRRIFSIWVKTHRFCEWSPESESWRLLAAEARIEDPCLVTPLAVAALLDAARADYAVVEALAAKNSPAIQERDARAEAKGIARSILNFLEARGIPLNEVQRQQILACRDLDRLDRWSRQAAVASSADELTLES
ncbi:MAG TPA: Uma2 family endonuclease [Thermoanaerobaculia bacterium]